MGKPSPSLWSDYAINQCSPILYGGGKCWHDLLGIHGSTIFALFRHPQLCTYVIEGVTLKLLIQVTIDAHVHLRSQVDGIHLIGQQVLDLIHDLLYLRVGPGAIN
jgi:hypothetical protein